MEQSSILTNNSKLVNSSSINHSENFPESDDRNEKTASKDVIKNKKFDKSSSIISSPSLGNRKRYKTSCMSNGLTHEQLKEIYSSCIRLSSENKINVKNAFGLQLIDYMQDLLTADSKNNASTNFQIAGCTLDASVKIYSYRVDSVHSDAIKIAGTLGSEQLPGEVNESDMLPDDSTNTDNRDALHQQNRRKLKKSRRHNTNMSTKIEQTIKNINLEQLQNENLDNNIQEINSNDCFSFGHMDPNPITSLLLSNLCSCSDMGSCNIDPSGNIFSTVKDMVWNDSNLKTDSSALQHVLKDFYENDECVRKLDNLVGFVDSFKFLNWDKPNHSSNASVLDNINVLTGIADNESDKSAIERHRKTLLHSVMIDTLHVMDETLKHDQSGMTSDINDGDTLNRDSQNVCPNNNDFPDFPQQASAIEFEFPNKTEAVLSKNEANLSVATAVTNGLSIITNSNVPLNMTGGLTLELSMEPGEYSYFKNLNAVRNNLSQIPNMWAGPGHWKHFGDPAIKGKDSVLQNTNSIVVTTKTRGQRKRKHLDNNSNFASNALCSINENVDFLEEISLEYQKSLKIGKASSTFSKNILAPSNAETITLTETDPVNIQSLFQLFLMPKVKLSHSFGSNNDGEIPMITLRDNQIYNYNNDNDRLNYCSGVFDDISDQEPFNDGDRNACAYGYPSPFKPSFRPTISQDDNKGAILSAFTQLPGGINQKNKIEYAKFAKQFDTRQIKSTLWNILKVTVNGVEEGGDHKNHSQEIIDGENSEIKLEDVDAIQTEQTMFNSVYHSLIGKLPTKSAENVSVPIALVCLLHLANEKNLSLVGNDQLNNILIKLNKNQ